jgi:hypothetical protein
MDEISEQRIVISPDWKTLYVFPDPGVATLGSEGYRVHALCKNDGPEYRCAEGASTCENHEMSLQLFRLERNGRLEGESYANPISPCDEWSKDPTHFRVAELDIDGNVVRYLNPDECRAAKMLPTL